ncbi:nuclear transport factor 2 family protein [Streptomyces sp. RKND-216]|uniref:nuclear transport factor 2 family protein n=1 Tax=Streptomyces sp. RKND-216 TaxID=2562581 RepID=UPI00109DD80C|nr:nuclear transport factor 2 family protein [Streptomyces sp. RKND-216]THA23955.1 nuclear transport factor 2 family protein [Streptomyces sp. RKND-216]
MTVVHPAQPAEARATGTESAESSESTVRRYYDLVDSGDVAGLVSLFTPDATYHRPGYRPMVGHEAMTSFYSGERVIKEGRHTLDTVVEHGARIAVHGEFNGVLRDESTVSLRFADFFQVAGDGRFSRRDTFFFAPLV